MLSLISALLINDNISIIVLCDGQETKSHSNVELELDSSCY